jgi:hypothetical protein
MNLFLVLETPPKRFKGILISTARFREDMPSTSNDFRALDVRTTDNTFRANVALGFLSIEKCTE